MRETTTLVLPVERVAAALTLIDGSRRDVVLFIPFGETFQDLIEAPALFLPAREGERIRIYARAAIAYVTVDAPPTAVATDAPAPRDLEVAVQLAGGLSVRGHLRYVARFERPRTADHLNEESRWFQIREGERVHHVAKAHVLCVEEL